MSGPSIVRQHVVVQRDTQAVRESVHIRVIRDRQVRVQNITVAQSSRLERLEIGLHHFARAAGQLVAVVENRPLTRVQFRGAVIRSQLIDETLWLVSLYQAAQTGRVVFNSVVAEVDA